MLEVATLFDLKANYIVLGCAWQSEDGLFLIENQQYCESKADSNMQAGEKGMMSIARRELARQQPSELHDCNMWHRRLGCTGPVKKVSAILKDGQLPHTTFTSPEGHHCVNRKLCSRGTRTLTKLENVSYRHTGLRSPVDTPCQDGRKHFFTIFKNLKKPPARVCWSPRLKQVTAW